jgi:hypothetical protein
MGMESVLEMPGKFHILTRPSAWEHFTELGYGLGDKIVNQLVQRQGLHNVQTLGPQQHPIQGIPAAASLGVKCPAYQDSTQLHSVPWLRMCRTIPQFPHTMGDPKIMRSFFWRGEGRYFRLLPLGACTWLPSTSVGQAASLRKRL